MAYNNISYKPSIKVYYNQDVSLEKFKEILWGIEEEGIPYELEQKTLDNSLVLGFEASLSSTLGVGIGIDTKEIVLHFNKLKKEKPLFILNLLDNTNKKRVIGTNAARLVTKLAFKEL